jgi:hypothetical protein
VIPRDGNEGLANKEAKVKAKENGETKEKAKEEAKEEKGARAIFRARRTSSATTSKVKVFAKYKLS